MSDSSADSGIIPLEEPARPLRAEPLPSAPLSSHKLCPNCGYDITGLTKNRCPECGGDLVLALSAKVRKDRVSQQYRAAIVRPLVMFAVGLLGTVVAVGLLYGWDLTPYYLGAFGLQVGNAIAVFFVCSLLWIGLDDPLPIMALKIGGLYAFLNFAELLLMQIPLLGGFFAMIFVSFAYLLMLMKLLDLEMFEALVVPVLTFLSKAIVVSIVLSMIAA